MGAVLRPRHGGRQVRLRLGYPRCARVVQCGYCQSAQLMAACALLKHKPNPNDADIDAAMTPVVCRCGTYPRVRAAIHLAARRMG